MLALAVSVALSSLAIGAILSTALLIGPAAAALRLTKTVPGALATACLTGVAATWLGILLAYDSYYWGPGHHSLPVSFFIVAIIFATYLAAGLPAARAAGASGSHPGDRRRRPRQDRGMKHGPATARGTEGRCSRAS